MSVFSEDSCVLSPGKSWVELIFSETHDFSRAVDGLVKEIYLGMIFLSLQVTVMPFDKLRGVLIAEIQIRVNLYSIAFLN